MLSISDKNALSMSADSSCECCFWGVLERALQQCHKLSSTTWLGPAWGAAAAAVQKRRTYKSTSVTQSVWFSFIREVLFAFIIFPYRLSLIRVSYIAKTTQLVKVTLAELKVNHQNGRWMKRNRAEQWKRERIALRSLYSFLFMPKFIFNIIMLYDFQNMHSTEHKETLNVLHLQRQS